MTSILEGDVPVVVLAENPIGVVAMPNVPVEPRTGDDGGSSVACQARLSQTGR